MNACSSRSDSFRVPMAKGPSPAMFPGWRSPRAAMESPLRAGESKSRPDQKRDAQIFERIVLQAWEQYVSENDLVPQPSGRHEQSSDLANPAPAPTDFGFRSPENQQRRHYNGAHAVSQPPGEPNILKSAQAGETAQRKRGDADRGAATVVLTAPARIGKLERILSAVRSICARSRIWMTR